MTHIEFVKFDTRADRTHYVAKRFEKYLQEKVLDVGCYEAPLRNILRSGSYVGVDMAGAPDIKVNLDSIDRLPFDDNAFPTVISIETLEHLENLHHMLSECIRVSTKHIVLSLPNCWRDARRPIERGKGEFAHYGLPIERPADRHRWFFSFTQARDFMSGIAEKHGLRVIELFGTEQPRNYFVRLARKLRFKPDAYANRYVQTVWAVLEKPAAS